VRLFVLPILAPALLECLGLNFLRKPRKQVGMAGGDALLGERLRDCRNELQKGKPRVDMACALACLLNQSGNVVAGHVEQTLESLRLLVRVDIDTLRVFQQSPHQGLCVVDVDDTGWQGKDFGDLGGAESSRSRNDLKAFGVGAHGNGLNEAVGADALGKLLQLAFVERSAGVVGRFVDLVDGNVLEFAAVLHDCSP
jgi:hypothetical protein